MTWFYLHCLAAVVVLIADARGTLEPSIIDFEKKVGLYVEPEKQTELEDEREGR